MTGRRAAGLRLTPSLARWAPSPALRERVPRACPRRVRVLTQERRRRARSRSSWRGRDRRAAAACPGAARGGARPVRGRNLCVSGTQAEPCAAGSHRGDAGPDAGARAAEPDSRTARVLGSRIPAVRRYARSAPRNRNGRRFRSGPLAGTRPALPLPRSRHRQRRVCCWRSCPNTRRRPVSGSISRRAPPQRRATTPRGSALAHGHNLSPEAGPRRCTAGSTRSSPTPLTSSAPRSPPCRPKSDYTIRSGRSTAAPTGWKPIARLPPNYPRCCRRAASSPPRSASARHPPVTAILTRYGLSVDAIESDLAGIERVVIAHR